MVTLDPNAPQLKAAQKWIDAYITRDIDEISAVCSKDYTHQTLPRSLGLPEETRAEYIQRCGGLLPSFTNFDVCIHRWVTGLQARRLIATAPTR